MTITDPSIESYAHQATQAEPALLEELIDYTHQHMDYPEKLSGRLVGRLLKLLITTSQARKVLEIGLFTGYSALSIAEGLPNDGKVISCESNPKAIDIARTFFERSPHGHKIDVRFGDAITTLDTINETFDFVFIDADKNNYLNYYEKTLAKLNSGGLMLIDNAFWSGRVLAPQDEKDHTLAALNQRIAKDNRVENVVLTVRDGLNLLRKK